MSKSGAIFLSIENIGQEFFIDVFESLKNIGWKLTSNGVISFMVNGSYDWQSAPEYNSTTVIGQVINSINNQQDASIDLTWRDDSTTIGLQYTGPAALMIKIVETDKFLGKTTITDFSWYLNNFIPILESYNFYRIECVYD